MGFYILFENLILFKILYLNELGIRNNPSSLFFSKEGIIILTYYYEGFENFQIIPSAESCPFDIVQFTNHLLLINIKAANDFIILPGEAKYIDTGLKISTNNKISITAGDIIDVVLKSNLNIISATTFRTGKENCIDTFKFVLHNYKIPTAYPVRVPGDKPSSMMSNKVKLINGEEVDTTDGLVAANSYLIKKNDLIARLIITKLYEIHTNKKLGDE